MAQREAGTADAGSRVVRAPKDGLIERVECLRVDGRRLCVHGKQENMLVTLDIADPVAGVGVGGSDCNVGPRQIVLVGDFEKDTRVQNLTIDLADKEVTVGIAFKTVRVVVVSALVQHLIHCTFE